MQKKREYSIVVKKDDKYYVSYCLEIPQAKGQGETRDEAVEDAKKAIALCLSYLEDKRNDPKLDLIAVSI